MAISRNNANPNPNPNVNTNPPPVPDPIVGSKSASVVAAPFDAVAGAGTKASIGAPNTSEPATATPQPVSTPQPAVMIAATSTSTPISDDDLPSILRRLNPIQRAKLRSAAISEGVIQRQSTGMRENPDGSISVMIRVDGDLVPQLKTWAEEAGKGLEQQIQEIVEQVLSSYLMSSWEAPPTAVAASV